jgi:ABC-2 type transport system ATP-binding protein
LAKTLLRSPKILLLDEPLANLDIISQQTILQDLKYMANSITAPFGMILSSQHIYEVEKVSDNIIFIKNGIAQYQNNTAPTEGLVEKQHNGLLLEVEVNCSRDQLATAFASMALQKIQFNGGVYLLHFDETTTVSTVLRAMASNDIEPGYFRNISQSSRRFFIN